MAVRRRTKSSRAASPLRKTSPKAKSSRDKVRAHRARLRKAGLRPVQIWIPDINSPEFIREAHRQSLAVARSPQEAEDQAFVDSISIWNDLRDDD